MPTKLILVALAVLLAEHLGASLAVEDVKLKTTLRVVSPLNPPLPSSPSSVVPPPQSVGFPPPSALQPPPSKTLPPPSTFPSPPVVKEPSPPLVQTPSPPLVPKPRPFRSVVPLTDCPPLCAERCKLHSRPNVCLRACTTCCSRCRCVPPGTYGNKDKCGKCYSEMTTHNNLPKCP